MKFEDMDYEEDEKKYYHGICTCGYAVVGIFFEQGGCTGSRELFNQD